MTPYELVDLRANVTDKILHQFRWWTSITFAVLVAAYTAGEMIAGLPCIIILLLYLAVSANNLATQVNMVRFINSLLDTAIACAGKNGSDLEPYIPILRSSKNARIVMTLQYVVRVVMAVATIVYVLYQAGYLT